MNWNDMHSPRMDVALLVLRLAVATIFIVHGSHKLFNSGISGVTGMFGQMGVPLPGVVAPVVTCLEFFGGIALVLGLLTPLIGLGLAIDMVGALVIVHIPAGLFGKAGGELPLVLFAGALALALLGGGRFSLDYLFARRGAGRLAAPENP
jgi:putative oxidoreductase